ncbi:hypothetical protein [Thermococcus sp.]|uniref:hypothetical protein n=1 Tax=Thermococcus sp. TaxID=35749 RepID=UPI0026329F0E|nr:hypothetical protein [Thermococcus sp.]
MKRFDLLLSFLEGFMVTWNPFTMAVAIAVSSIAVVVTKFKTTPMKNVLFLGGAFGGWAVTYLAVDVPFYKWEGIWWIPTGLVVASALGIP